MSSQELKKRSRPKSKQVSSTFINYAKINRILSSEEEKDNNQQQYETSIKNTKIYAKQPLSSANHGSQLIVEDSRSNQVHPERASQQQAQNDPNSRAPINQLDDGASSSSEFPFTDSDVSLSALEALQSGPDMLSDEDYEYVSKVKEHKQIFQVFKDKKEHERRYEAWSGRSLNQDVKKKPAEKKTESEPPSQSNIDDLIEDAEKKQTKTVEMPGRELFKIKKITGTDQFVALNILKRKKQNGAQIKEKVMQDGLDGVTCQKKHFLTETSKQEKCECIKCRMTIPSKETHYTCQEQCTIYCSRCARVRWYEDAINQEQGNNYFQIKQEIQAVDEFALSKLEQSETKVVLGWSDGDFINSVLIEILQYKQGENLVRLCELEVPEEPFKNDFEISHSRDAVFWQTKNNRLLVVYLNDLSYRLFNQPEGFPKQSEWQKRSVSLVYDNRLISYRPTESSSKEPKTSQLKMGEPKMEETKTGELIIRKTKLGDFDQKESDEQCKIVLFDLHKQTEFLTIRNVWAILFDSPPLKENMKAIQSAYPQGLQLKSTEQETNVRTDIHKYIVTIAFKLIESEQNWEFDLFDHRSFPEISQEPKEKAFYKFVQKKTTQNPSEPPVIFYQNASTSQIALRHITSYQYCSSFTLNERRTDKTDKRTGKSEDAATGFPLENSHLSNDIYCRTKKDGETNFRLHKITETNNSVPLEKIIHQAWEENEGSIRAINDGTRVFIHSKDQQSELKPNSFKKHLQVDFPILLQAMGTRINVSSFIRPEASLEIDLANDFFCFADFKDVKSICRPNQNNEPSLSSIPLNMDERKKQLPTLRMIETFTAFLTHSNDLCTWCSDYGVKTCPGSLQLHMLVLDPFAPSPQYSISSWPKKFCKSSIGEISLIKRVVIFKDKNSVVLGIQNQDSILIKVNYSDRSVRYPYSSHLNSKLVDLAQTKEKSPLAVGILLDSAGQPMFLVKDNDGETIYVVRIRNDKEYNKQEAYEEVFAMKASTAFMFVRKPAMSLDEPESFLLMDDQKTIHVLQWRERKLETQRLIKLSLTDKLRIETKGNWAQVLVSQKLMYLDKNAIRLFDSTEKNTLSWRNEDLEDEFFNANGTHAIWKWEEKKNLATIKNFADDSSFDCCTAGANFATFIGDGLRLIKYGYQFCVFDQFSLWKSAVSCDQDLLQLEIVTCNPVKKLFVFKTDLFYCLFKLIEKDGSYKFEYQRKTRVIEGAKLLLTSDDKLLQIEPTIKEKECEVELTTLSDENQKPDKVTFKFFKNPKELFFTKSGNMYIVQSENEIYRSVVLKGKNRVVPGKLKISLQENDKIITVQETQKPNEVIFFVQTSQKNGSNGSYYNLITWDLKNNEEVRFYQTDKPCILMPRLVENDKQIRPNMLLTSEFIVDLETNKPVQIFSKLMLDVKDDFNHEIKADLISPTCDALIDPNFSGRLHYFHSLLDLRYLRQLKQTSKDGEKKRLEKLLVRVSPFRVFVKDHPILHEFADDTDFMNFLLKIMADKLARKPDVYRTTMMIHFLTEYNNFSPIMYAHKKKEQESFNSMLDLINQVPQVRILTEMFNQDKEIFIAESPAMKEYLETGFRKVPEIAERLLLEWYSEEDTIIAGIPSLHNIKEQVQDIVRGFKYERKQKAACTSLMRRLKTLYTILVYDLIMGRKYLVDESVQSRKIEVSILDFDLFKEENANELFDVLAKGGDQMFAKKQVQVFLNALWDRMFYKYLMKLCMPFVFYAIGFALSVSVVRFDQGRGFSYYKSGAFGASFVCFCSTFSNYIYIELSQISRQKSDYFKDVWNILDLLSLGLCGATYAGMMLSYFDEKTFNVLAAFATLSLWFKTFYWIRMFQEFGVFVRIITEIVADIKIFTVMLIFTVAGFASTMYFLNLNRDDDAQLFDTITNLRPIDSMVRAWLTSLGDSFQDNFSQKDLIPVWMTFIAATFILQLVFMNLLIAIMGDAFGKIYGAREQSTWNGINKLMCDYKDIFEFEEIFKGMRYAIFINSKPTDQEVTLDSVDRKLGALQNNMKWSFKDSKDFNQYEFILTKKAIKEAHDETNKKLQAIEQAVKVSAEPAKTEDPASNQLVMNELGTIEAKQVAQLRSARNQEKQTTSLIELVQTVKDEQVAIRADLTNMSASMKTIDANVTQMQDAITKIQGK